MTARLVLACCLLGGSLVACGPGAAPTGTVSPAAQTAMPAMRAPTATPTWQVTIDPPCELAAESEITAWERPGLEAEVFALVPCGMRVYVEARTSDGWIGFDPGMAQAGNVGVFRLRWVPPGGCYALVGVCDDLPVVQGPAAGVCFLMCTAETPLYREADVLSPWVAMLQAADYARVLAVGEEWVQVDLGAGSAGLDESGWVQRQLASFNGPCHDLPAAKP